MFEGSEKKVELVVSSTQGSLRHQEEAFWRQVVEASQAQILSKLQSKDCDAYLLSESSLFVWDDRFTLITCGQTALVKAILKFFETFPKEECVSLFFERKNEYFPHHQPSDFIEDVRVLNELLPGQAYRFGEASEHHVFLFHLNRNYQPPEGDRTLELLMYDLQGPVKEIFSTPGLSSGQVREKLEIEKNFPEFEVDDYVFEPCGYSINALKGKEYYTIHITPQEGSSYVSFETNMNHGKDYYEISNRVIQIFQPRAFDVVRFHTNKLKPFDFPKFIKKNEVVSRLDCGYEVNFSHFFFPKDQAQQPQRIRF